MINFPVKASKAIEHLLKQVSADDLQRAAFDLSERYRCRQPHKFMETHMHHLAYLATRFPATFVVISQVISNLPAHSSESVLDLGAGLGAGYWAFATKYPALQQITCVEYDQGLIQLGQCIQQANPITKCQWIQANLIDFLPSRKYDWVLMSYALNELPAEVLFRVIQMYWEVAKSAFIIIDPGTPEAFKRMRSIREYLIELGATIYAPCPHNLSCPLGYEDWCHFSQRLHRSFVHRKCKDASLPYEDEKYSYLIATRSPQHACSGRIIRDPLRRSGHVTLDICHGGSLERCTIGKKSKELYKISKKKTWGDSWNFFDSSEKELLK